jgi:hypothetical protein
MNAKNPAAADKLLVRLNEAVAAVNEAQKTAETAKAELISRSMTVGRLLLEAKKLYPALKDFNAYLAKVNGLGQSRAYELLALAGGRKTDEEIRQATRNRVKRHRAKSLPKAKPIPLPEPKLVPEQEPVPEPGKVSVTSPNVTESEAAEASAEQRKAAYAAAEPADHSAANDSPAPEETWKSNAFGGVSALSMFKAAADQWLPQMSEPDRVEAINYVHNFFNKKEAA